MLKRGVVGEVPGAPAARVRMPVRRRRGDHNRAILTRVGARTV